MRSLHSTAPGMGRGYLGAAVTVVSVADILHQTDTAREIDELAPMDLDNGAACLTLDQQTHAASFQIFQ